MQHIHVHTYMCMCACILCGYMKLHIDSVSLCTFIYDVFTTESTCLIIPLCFYLGRLRFIVWEFHCQIFVPRLQYLVLF